MTALHDLSATELVARFRERSLSPVEVTRTVTLTFARPLSASLAFVRPRGFTGTLT